MENSRKSIFKFFAIFAILMIGSTVAWACTRILLENKYGVLVGRNMDWKDWENAGYKILIFPRGEERTGGTDVNPLTWKSKYGSLGISMYDITTPEGINEEGLSVMALYLPGSDYGKERDPNRKGLFITLFTQFFLDNFATVKEAVNYLQENNPNIQIMTVALPSTEGAPVGLHLALQDSTGDSAIIEYSSTNGEATIYHGKEYNVLTNQPAYPGQIENLKIFKDSKGFFRDPNEEQRTGFSAIFDIFEPAAVNGYSRPKDRFVRATYYASLAKQKEPENYIQHLAQMRGLMGNIAQLIISQQKGASYETSRTNYTTLSDLTNMKFYMTMIDFNNLVSVDIKQLNFEEGSPTLYFDVDRIDAHGDITDKFQPIPEDSFFFITEAEYSTFEQKARF